MARPRRRPRPACARTSRRRGRGSCSCSSASAWPRCPCCWPSRADLRPVGLDHLGARDHPPRPRTRARPVLEAAAGPLHGALRAVRRRGGARPVARDRPRRRAAAVAMAFRLGARLAGPVGGRHRGRRARARRRVRAQLRARQLGGASSSRSACGRSSATSTAAGSTPSLLGFAAALLRPEVWPFLGALRALARVAGPAPARARGALLRRARRVSGSCPE